jgi:hypothetical protein
MTTIRQTWGSGPATVRNRAPDVKLTRKLVDRLAAALYESRDGRRPVKSDTWAKLVAPVSDGRDGKWKHRSVVAFYRGLARTALKWFGHELIVEVSGTQVEALQQGVETILRVRQDVLVKGTGTGNRSGP